MEKSLNGIGGFRSINPSQRVVIPALISKFQNIQALNTVKAEAFIDLESLQVVLNDLQIEVGEKCKH